MISFRIVSRCVCVEEPWKVFLDRIHVIQSCVDLGMKSRLDSLANVPKKEYDDEYLDELSLPLTRSANACQKLSAASRIGNFTETRPSMIPTNLVKFFDTIETRIDLV